MPSPVLETGEESKSIAVCFSPLQSAHHIMLQYSISRHPHENKELRPQKADKGGDTLVETSFKTKSGENTHW
jgi:hypothetical protein